MSRLVVPLLVLTIVLIGVTMLAAILLDFPKFYSLANHARSATAKVTSKERANHMSIRFQYEVDDQIFSSVGRGEDIGKTFETVEVGDMVPIVYDTSNPQSSVMGEPEKYLYGSIRGIAFIFLGLSVCLLWYLFRLRLRK